MLECSLQLYFTTVRRQAPLAEGGSLVRLDWDTRQVLGSLPMVPREPLLDDPNPRGSTRGGRGIARVGPHLVAGTFHTLVRFTPDLELVDGATHPLLAGIHQLDVAPGQEAVWAAATNVDAALLVRLGTGELLDQRWPRESPGLQDALGLTPLPMDKHADQRGAFLTHEALHEAGRVHLNAVRLHGGRLIGLMNRRGAIVDLDAGRVLVRHPSLVGAHDLVTTAEGTVIVNDTVGGRVRWFDLATGGLLRTVDLRAFPWVRELEASAQTRSRAAGLVRRVFRGAPVSRPLFVRGLAHHDGRLFVGVSPASILELDERTGALLGSYQHSILVDDCVHGLLVWT